MAREFVAASTEYLSNNSAVLTAYPFTMGAWGYANDLTGYHCLISLGDIDITNNYFGLFMEGAETNDPITAVSYDNTWQTAKSTSSYSASTWHHCVGIWNSDADRVAYIDGGSKGTNSDDQNMDVSAVDNIALGATADSSPFGYIDGRIAEAAIWNAALTDAEVGVLATGISPLDVRPGNLVFYCPLVRDNDEDIVGGLSLSASGSPTIAAHPPVMYPAPPMFYMKESESGLTVVLDTA